MRLSRDDGTGESESIENQRIILRKFVSERGGAIVDEYIDDGFSGTNFDRPDVKRLLSDAQSGRIDTIVVKDLSRFGRNYIQVGQYIDYIFPAYGIRFIAIGDNVDTSERESQAMDMMPIMNVFNEWHAASTSKKIRAVLLAKQRAGKCTGWAYPYGYKAGVDENRTAVIDEDAARVVRRIYELRASGHSARYIARILTDSGVENPTNHFRKKDGERWNRPCSPYWWPSTVADILDNPVYIGTAVQHKTTSVSYKNRKQVAVPEGERVVKPGAHEPIISRELWDRVQAMKGTKGKADKSGAVHNLSGLLVCPDCGRKLRIKTSKGGAVYCCRTYTDLGKKYCSSHGITEKEIESLVLSDLAAMCGGVFDEQKARERFVRERIKNDEKRACSDKKRLSECARRMSELDRLMAAAYEDRVNGKIPEDVCLLLLKKFRKEKNDLEKEIATVEKRLEDKGDDEAEYLERVREYGKIGALTRELCLALIEFITVGEKSETGERDIHIYYRSRGGRE